jgi:hypothetical protein
VVVVVPAFAPCQQANPPAYSKAATHPAG